MSAMHADPDSRDPRIKGSFLGGPSRPGEGGSPHTRPVQTVEEIEHGLVRRRMYGVRSRRRSRSVWGMVAVVAVAGAVGYLLGLGSHRTQEELRSDAEAGARKELDLSISKEVNRTLLELWKMEDVEAMRNRR